MQSKARVSPEGTHMNTMDSKVTKLQQREAALNAQAKQLQERAAHLERVRLNHTKKLSRRIDAHEKIVLGALVKKAGLDTYRAERHPNDPVITPNQFSIEFVSTTYDRELIFGALLWLASALKHPHNADVRDLNHAELRKRGKDGHTDTPMC